VGGGYQRFGGFALQARQVDVQFDLQAEAAGNLADADLAGYMRVTCLICTLSSCALSKCVK